MKKEAYDLMEYAEDTWWYKGKRAAIRSVLKGENFGTALDYGAGFGGMFEVLGTTAQSVFAYEPEPYTHKSLERRGYKGIYDTVDETLSHKYDFVGFFDVIEHVQDDLEISKRLFDSLNPGGKMVVTTGAYQWLWSAHDTNHMHFRRYTATSLKRVLESAGFQVEYIGYWNMCLLIPLAFIRLLGGTGESGFNAPWYISGPVTLLLRVEALVLRYIPLPFGVSVIARVKKL